MCAVNGVLPTFTHCPTQPASPERSNGMGSPDPDGHDREERRDRAVNVIVWSLLGAVVLLAALGVLLVLAS